jgi:copper(I)-binding protein
MSPSLHRSLLTATLLVLTPFATHAADSLSVSIADPYVRATPPGQPNSAAFMTLTNASPLPRALVSATSPAAKTVELHTHVKEDGIMRMRQVERIEIPAGQTVTLAPGGLHVMLIGLEKELKPGVSVDLSLSFDDGSEAKIQAPVRKIEPMKTSH